MTPPSVFFVHIRQAALILFVAVAWFVLIIGIELKNSLRKIRRSRV